MPLIIGLLLFLALKYFAVGPFANMSWGWFVGACVAVFIWFEFGERIFGLDKRAAHDKMDKMREERVKKAFSKDKR